MAEPPSTPPQHAVGALKQKSPLTPEQVRRIEENRLRAKALRTQRDASTKVSATTPNNGTAQAQRSECAPSNHAAFTGQKRPFSATASSRAEERTVRDARQTPSISNNHNPTAPTPPPPNGAPLPPTESTAGPTPHADIQPARKFAKYIDYDFSRMTDTKGGFLTHDDDPHNRALHNPAAADKPAHMTLAEWERHQLLKKLRDQRAGPFEPSMSGLPVGLDGKSQGCRECGSVELDWTWLGVFGAEFGRVCGRCKERLPDKYSLLTKTEAKEDYLLTDPELKDSELLPHLEKPNPHRANWNSMQLFLRCQVESYALTKKWGSGEALDAEYERRQKEKKRKKEAGFKNKLAELKKRTRVEAYKRERERDRLARMAGEDGLAAGGGAQFGDDMSGGRHEHEFGRAVENADGCSVKRCVGCGFEVEELEF